MSFEQDVTLFQIWKGRPGGQLGSFVVVDQPNNLPESWTTQLDRPSGTTFAVLTDEGRAHLARVADENQHTHSWGAHLVRSWIGRWTEHNEFFDYISKYPKQHPGVFSGGAKTWQHWELPPVHNGDDIAARALYFAHLNPVEARTFVMWCEPKFGECVCGECWRVDTNLKLARLSPSEALTCWPKS